MSKNGQDQLDSKIFGVNATNFNLTETTSNVKVTRSTKIPTHYKNNNKRMGRALIFNHIKFEDCDERCGTEEDVKRLEITLKNYGFDVRIENDLQRDRINEVLKEVAKEDHLTSNCFLLIVMSHGNAGDQIYASDGLTYTYNELWKPFSGDKCPTLIDKPKLFFIQKCRGEDADPGIKYQVDSFEQQSDYIDALSTYTLPTTADILLYFSTMPGFVSFRRITGSWFIQTICLVLEEYLQNVNGIDLYEFLTAVNREVAYDYESNMQNDKKIS